MISAVFRRGGEVAFVVEELKAVFDPRGGAWMEGRYVPSILAAIGDAIERHMRRTGFLPPEAPRAEAPAPKAAKAPPPQAEGVTALGPSCPNCGTPGAMEVEGCLTCPTCGYSQCG
jgi:ribonucleoside-diphosphate reductase alpha chain